MTIQTILALQTSQAQSLLPTATPSAKRNSTPARHQRWNASVIAAALTLAVLPAAPTFAQTLTATQNVDVSGEYLPPCPTPCGSFPDPQPIVYTPYSGSSLGVSNHDFSSVKGIDEGTASWNASIDSQGFVRTQSDLAIKKTFTEDDDAFNNLKVEVSSTVKYSDTIELAPGEFQKRIVFQTRLTGRLFNNVVYSDPSVDGAFAATYESTAQFSGRIASTGLLNDIVIAPIDAGETSIILESPGIFNEYGDDSDVLDITISFDSVIWQLSGGSVEFEWEYSDSFLVDIEGIDAGWIDIFMENDLSSTAVTTASVYDMEGNLLPDERVVNVSGYEYGLNPVPVPAAAWLFGSALIGLMGMARRKKQ